MQADGAMEMTLADLYRVIGGELHGRGATVVTGIASSHTDVKAGDLFIAIRGNQSDGHDYVGVAAQAGASSAVVSVASRLADLPGIVVSDPSVVKGRLASTMAGSPTKNMTVIAVTGTNGKTTIHWLMSKLLSALGKRSIRIGTLGIDVDDDFHEPSLTTPDAVYLQRALRRALARNVTYACLEASSHALMQNRLIGVELDVAIFTNLTRDHLDYHENMEAYRALLRGKRSLDPQEGNPEQLDQRLLPSSQVGDYLVIEGTGAYCSSMSAKDYNSFPKAPEILLKADGSFRLIRRRQTLEQIFQNEMLDVG